MTVRVALRSGGEVATATSPPRARITAPPRGPSAAVQTFIDLTSVDNECAHGRLPFDSSDPCGCWPLDLERTTFGERERPEPLPLLPPAIERAPDLEPEREERTWNHVGRGAATDGAPRNVEAARSSSADRARSAAGAETIRSSPTPPSVSSSSTTARTAGSGEAAKAIETTEVKPMEAPTGVPSFGGADLDELPRFVRGLVEQIDQEIERLAKVRAALIEEVRDGALQRT